MLYSSVGLQNSVGDEAPSRRLKTSHAILTAYKYFRILYNAVFLELLTQRHTETGPELNSYYCRRSPPVTVESRVLILLIFLFWSFYLFNLFVIFSMNILTLDFA
jgi:hypothetical protein